MSYRILVVDDDPDLNNMLVELLSGEGFLCNGVESGTEALNELHMPPLPDLVLLDVMLPDLNGFEILRKIKDNPKLSRIHVVMISTWTDYRNIRLAKYLGAVDYIAKPFVSVDLVAYIKKIVSFCSKEDEKQDTGN